MKADKNFDALIDATFDVPFATRAVTRVVHRRTGLWVKLGNLETKVYAEKLDTTPIDRPLFIAGLARSGSTKLLEVVASIPRVATHQYRDFPLIFTPIWGQRFTGSSHTAEASERAHGDGIMVTPESPEAMEEPLWMAFFPHAHDETRSQVLDGATDAPRFESFYKEHINKILWIRGGVRYASKGNYNLTRLEYIQKLFPAARFVLPIRSPAAHVASLIKQQRLFSDGEMRYPHALAHMQAVGHFEFGLDRRLINVGDRNAICAVAHLWDRGEMARSLAKYWASLYGWIAQRLAENMALRQAVIVVRYEDLCSHPTEQLGQVFEHCELDVSQSTIDEQARQIRAPTYYDLEFSTDDLNAIDEEAGAVAARFGYAATVSR